MHPHPWAGTKRWELEKVDSHELYDLGHLYEAAAAHYQATGKRTLLDIALRSAALLENTFGPGKQSIWPGHQITEMGLAKLYRVTGDAALPESREIHAGCARSRWLARRRTHLQPVAHEGGRSDRSRGPRGARHLYVLRHGRCGGADRRYGYVHAIDKIWDNVAGKKLYITGGIGATAAGEAFGKNYELPNMTAYNETCAAVGNDYWNHRLFLLHADARYIDVMERTLYNGLISGVSLDGKTLLLSESAGIERAARAQSVVRRGLLPGQHHALPGLRSRLRVRAARRSAVREPLRGQHRRHQAGQRPHGQVTQETRYPWDGGVKMTVKPDQPGEAHDQRPHSRLGAQRAGAERPLPVRRQVADAPSVKVNGKAVPMQLTKGYVTIDRTWKAGDRSN